MNRRRFLALAANGTLAGCAYHPGAGDPRWSVDVGSGGYRPDALLAVGGDVATVNREYPGFDFDSERFAWAGRVAGYDPATGAERWHVEPGATLADEAVHDGTLYLGTAGGTVTAVADGERQWSVDTGGSVGAVAADATGAYALVEGPRLVAVGEGERRWTVDLPRGILGTLAATGGRACVVGPEPRRRLLAYADGERRWETPLAGRYDRGSPVGADGTVYVPGGGLVAVDAANGEWQWRYSLGTSAGAVAVAGDTAYLLAFGRLYAVVSGETRWTRPAATLPAVAGDALYVGTRDGLRALDAADGSRRWGSDVPVETAPVVVGDTVAVLGASSVAGYWRIAP